MTLALCIVSALYWLAVTLDIVTTRAAIARGGVESNRRYVGRHGRVLYGRNLLMSAVTWGCGAAVAIFVPFPFGAVGLVWIVVRGAFRAADAWHNHHEGRA